MSAKIAGASSPADLSNEAVRRQLGPAGWKACRRLMKIWQVPAEQERRLLGLSSDAALDDLYPERVGEDQLRRISYLCGIAKALRILHRGELANKWVNLPNANLLFGGKTPLAYMAEGGTEALRNVRRLLDARCAGN